MKFKINKDVLLENLNNVGRALSNRNIIPVINGILFELNEDGLSLMATDNEITIKTFIDKSNIKEIVSSGKIAIIIIIPIACCYPFFQKYFISGLTVGAVKG